MHQSQNVVVDRHYHSWEMHNQCGSRCHDSVGEYMYQVPPVHERDLTLLVW